MRGFALVALLASVWPALTLAQAPRQEALSLAAPLDCTAEAGCFIQNYWDLDPGPGVRDPFCGGRSYDGHDGLDVRVRSAAARDGVIVRAPIAGRIRGARDGETDGLARQGRRSEIAGRECGNGVVIARDDGVEVQLCHLRQGSLRVRAGDAVAAGAPVGLVGQSGLAEFPHVHVALRRQGVKLEPGAGAPLAGAACTTGPPRPGALWSADAVRALPFARQTGVADWGFAEEAPTDAGTADLLSPATGRRDAPLVFFAMFGRPEPEQRLVVRLLAPDGTVLAENAQAQRTAQAQRSLFAGKRAPAGGWSAGVYRGVAEISRGGVAVERREAAITLR